MTSKEYLSQFRKRETAKQKLYEDLETIRIRMMGVSSVTFDDVKTSGHGTTSRQEAMISVYMGKCDALCHLIGETAELRCKTFDQLMKLDDRLAGVLYWRYLCGEPFARIAARTGYSQKHLSRLNKEALEAFQVLLDAEEAATG